MGSNDIFAYTHRIHGTGIYTYIYHKNQPNVGKYTGPMDPMGHEWLIFIGTYTVPPIGSEKGMVLMVLTVEIMSYWYEKKSQMLNVWYIYTLPETNSKRPRK